LGSYSPKTLSHKAVILDKVHYFSFLCLDCQGKRLEKEEDFRPLLKIATRNFPNNEGIVMTWPSLSSAFRPIVQLRRFCGGEADIGEKIGGHLFPG
jgi:hypothetical protein